MRIAAPERVGSRARLIVVLAGLAALAPLCTDLNLPVLPALAADLRVDAATAQLTITFALVGLATGQLVAGPLSDRFGRRPLLLGGLVAFAIANLASAVAPTAAPLVVVRLLAGLAASATVVVTRAVVADTFPGVEAARGYATLGAVMGFVPAAAPLLGGGLSYVMGWRGMFVVLAAIAVALLLLAHLQVPETLPVELRRPAQPRAIVTALADCLRHRRFLANLAAIGMAGGTLFTYIGSSSFVLENLYGLSPVAFSVVFAVNALGIVAAATLTRRLVSRAGASVLMSVGQAIAVAGAVVLLAGALAGGGLVPVLAGFFCCVASGGFVMSTATALGMEAAPGGAGAAAGLLGVTAFAVGGLLAPLGGLGSGGTAMAVVMTATTVLGPGLRWVALRGADRP